MRTTTRLRYVTVSLALWCLAISAHDALAQPWWNTSWSNRLRLTFDNSGQAQNLGSFPVLVVLNSSRVNYTDFQPNGEDLRFIDADGTTVLAHEIESWDTSGISTVWVNVPQIDGNSIVDYIMMYYGNPSAPDGQQINNTWEPGYTSVWHLPEDPGGAAPQMLDSTSNALHGTSTGGMGPANQVQGKIDGSLNFDGVNDDVSVTSATLGVTAAITLEAWVNPQSNPPLGDWPGLIGRKQESNNTCGYTLQKGTSDTWWFFAYIGGAWRGVDTGVSSVNFGVFQHVAATYDGATLRIYKNGAPVNTTSFAGTICNPGAVPLRLARNNDTGGGGLDYHLQGILDEARVSSVVRSSDWIAAQFLSMEDTFITYGSPASPMLVQTGSYVGDGNDNRIIAGAGFAPDIVIVKGDQAAEAVTRTSTMTGDSSKPLVSTAGVGVDMIQALNTDGFAVGTDARVNASGVTFHWTAFKAGPGQLTVGSYTGDGIDNRSIAGVGFQPDYVVIIPENARDAFHRFAGQAGDKSTAFEGGVPNPDRIQALEADGFQIGGSTTVNASAVQYHYAAWKNTAKKISVGSYMGDGLDNHSIPGVGLSPEIVIVQRDAVSGQTASILKPVSTGASTDTSVFLNAAANQSDNIQALEVDGFQVGTLQRVNNGGDTFYYAAFGNAEVNYRSIGNAPDYTAGTVTATAGSRLVYGAGTEWQTFNRGRGDRIRIDGVDYQVESLQGDTLLTLRKPFAGVTGSGKAYTLARQFTGAAGLQNWESCVSFSVPCTFFSVSSGSLVSDNREEIGIAYDDGGSFTSFTIDGSTTDPTHRITLTADGGNRHYGLPNQGVRIIGGAGVVIRDDYVTLEWMEISGTTDGIFVAALSAGASQVVLQNNLIHNTGDRGIEITTNDGAIDIINSIIHSNGAHGIDLPGTPGPLARYRILNNTVANNSTNGINKQSGAASPVVLLRNNISVGNSTFDYSADPTDSVDPASSNNLDEDGTGGALHSPAGGAVTSSLLGVQFVAGGNLHINPGSTAEGAGADLSALFSTDIDAATRETPWDIGADDAGASVAPTTNYRSIGTAPPYSTGNVSAVAGSAIVTGTADWVAANRGRGDHIDINGNPYTILSVDTPTQLTLTSPAVASFSGPTYTISRQFSTLQAWEDCISFAVSPCPNFPVSSADFVADNRKEIGIAYKDSAFTSTGGVPIVLFDGSTTDGSHDITLTADGVNRHYGIPGGAGNNVLLDMVAEGGSNAVQIRDEFVTVEWLEIINGSGMDGFEVAGLGAPSHVILRNNLIRDTASGDGMQLRDADLSVDVYNNIIYGVSKAIEFNVAVPTSARILNNTIFNSANGVFADDSVGGCNGCKFDTVLLHNNIAHTFTGIAYYVPSTSSTGFATNASSNNLASDGTGTTHSAAGGGINSVPLANMNFVSATDLHITSGSAAEDLAADLSNDFNFDIDGGPRQTPWDIGADDIAATTEVELVSFDARGLDGAVELTWETATELDNVGFHLYRAASLEGSFERVTSQVIPGLGSSPAGAFYRYVDDGLVNGSTYYYELEDIETTGRTERHGPVSATPMAGGVSTKASPRARITYGEPEANGLRIVKRTDRFVELVLVTRGFYAAPNDDGTVDVSIPDFVSSDEASVPVKRFWIDLPEGRAVKRVRVVERDVERFSGLSPAGVTAELVAERDGTVRVRRRRRQARRDLLPERAGRVVSQGFQGSEHKALIELAPVRWAGELVLSQRLVVRVVLGNTQRQRTRARGQALVRLATSERGLYVVRHRGRRARLSRQGESVPYHREGPMLYFLGEEDAVYELSGASGAVMDVVDGTPSGAVQHYYWHTERREENRLYQAALVNAPDVWLWDYLLAPMEKDFTFEVSELASTEPATLRVWLQGTSALAHHVRFLVNGTFVGEARWDGKQAHVFEALASVREGTNTLTLASVGETYSMVMLDRFEIEYPRRSVGEIEGRFGAGTADVGGLDAALVVDVTDENTPRWVEAEGARFPTEEGRRYVVTTHARTPEVRAVRRSNLSKRARRAEWILIAPEAFVDDARPLVRHRKAQGLRARAVTLESIYDAFGYGEQRPEAIRDFLRAVYQETGSLRYVVLLGDGTFDFEDYLGTGVQNQVPPMMVRTSYLWTASDPAYAAVNGNDLLPDIAIGRLPAANRVEARIMVQKILAYERGEASVLDGPVVLVADNPDRAGDFIADADALAATLLSGKTTTKLYLPGATREDVIQSFDDGASLMSYLGHGAIHLWADENIFNANDVASLSSQTQQPLLLTMNCLNGYFHFPYFDSLAEALLKAEDKGVIAAFSPSGLSLNEPAKRYQEALVDELFHGGHRRLGDAVLEAQKRYADAGVFPELLTIYHLFGDPALALR